MNLTEPMLSVVPGVTGSVLAVLARTTEPLTGRAVAQLVKPAASQRGVANVLALLVDAGVVDRADKGSSALYTLNRDHVAASALTELAELRQLVINRLANAIASWTPAPASATIFGSFARGEGGGSSDIDLLLVRPSGAHEDWASNAAMLTSEVLRWTGNPLNIIDIPIADLGMFRDEAFIKNAGAEGTTVAGEPLRKLLRRGPVGGA